MKHDPKDILKRAKLITGTETTFDARVALNNAGYSRGSSTHLRDFAEHIVEQADAGLCQDEGCSIAGPHVCINSDFSKLEERVIANLIGQMNTDFNALRTGRVKLHNLPLTLAQRKAQDQFLSDMGMKGFKETCGETDIPAGTYVHVSIPFTIRPEKKDEPAPAPANDNKAENTVASENLGDVKYETQVALERLATVVEPERLDVMRRLLVVQDTCYGLAHQAGWWIDAETGEDVRTWPKKFLDLWISAKLMLVVTEVAEAMEGHRKGLRDDKLQHRQMLEVELADAVIRCMDLAGGLNMDLAGAIVEKLAYNLTRADHKPENRAKAGGKAF